MSLYKTFVKVMDIKTDFQLTIPVNLEKYTLYYLKYSPIILGTDPTLYYFSSGLGKAENTSIVVVYIYRFYIRTRMLEFGIGCVTLMGMDCGCSRIITEGAGIGCVMHRHSPSHLVNSQATVFPDNISAHVLCVKYHLT